MICPDQGVDRHRHELVRKPPPTQHAAPARSGMGPPFRPVDVPFRPVDVPSLGAGALQRHIHGSTAAGAELSHARICSRTAAVICSARAMMASALPAAAIISRLACSSVMLARLISTFTLAVAAAARAASAPAATSEMTLRLPIAASALARSTTIPATLMTWVGGQAALISAWAMAAERE